MLPTSLATAISGDHHHQFSSHGSILSLPFSAEGTSPLNGPSITSTTSSTSDTYLVRQAKDLLVAAAASVLFGAADGGGSSRLSSTTNGAGGGNLFSHCSGCSAAAFEQQQQLHFSHSVNKSVVRKRRKDCFWSFAVCRF